MEKKKVVIIAIAAGIVIVLFALAFVFKDKILKNDNKKDEPEQSEGAEGNLTDDFSKNDASAYTETAYNLMQLLKIDTVNLCSTTNAKGMYYRDNFTASSIPDGFKIYIGIMQYAESRKFSSTSEIILTKEEVKAGAKKVFGPNVTYKDQTIGGTACIGSYDSFSYDAATGNYTIKPKKCDCDASKGEVFTKVVNTKEENNQIIVTQKMLVATTNYNSETDKATSKLFTTLDVTKEPIAEVEKYSFNDYESKLNSYNFTFTKNSDGNYYFTSVELVK